MDIFSDISDLLRHHELAFYLGPDVSAITAKEGTPVSTKELADFLGQKVALPRRAKGNPWVAAQYIESHRHRKTLTTIMNAAFETPVPPSPLHQVIADLRPPIIVDSWYDGAMRQALSNDTALNWGEIQGINHAVINEYRWFAAYNATGEEVPIETAEEWQTVLYKPHGSVTPHQNYLVSDSDYVEVLTEIDIQTPIPEVVQKRRASCGFLFIGCRFYDQMLRSFARQIIKRSKAPHFAVVDIESLTKNELRFFEELQITPIPLSLEKIADLLSLNL
ncbi:MAG: SIR2 family protein [Zymomonas mobilis]|uniref:SIR2-like protein n=1 Tax=Zymomonas mobilis TaxID=542 RepID=A0A542W3B9_ZYMMB|nr:SIR2 family protein [Zymomonas mobilis]TQL18102.1 SIR2-like protein [Zymomonas mobilis]